MKRYGPFLIPVKINWNNDVGYNDEGYWEWWEVIDAENNVLAKCDEEKIAEELIYLINTWGNEDSTSQFG